MAPAVEVRDAQPGDADALVTLWRELTTAAHSARLPAAPTPAAAAVAIGKQLDDPAGRLLVGVIDGAVGGLAYLRRTVISPLHDETTATVEYLHVTDRARRHGVGKALVAEAAAWAEQEGCPHLAVVAPAVDREANRFLARLGLPQAGTLRFASTLAVRRRLAADHAPNLMALLSTRRSARRAQLHRNPFRPAPLDHPVPAEPESAGT